MARGDDSIVQFERWLLTRDDSILDDIESYNEEDCASTWRLRDWLLSLRQEYEGRHGESLSFRRVHLSGVCHEQPIDGCDTLADALVADVGAAPAERSHAMARPRARALHHDKLLDYHHNEEKPAWWRIFDRAENVDELQEHDHERHRRPGAGTDLAPYKDKPAERIWSTPTTSPTSAPLGDMAP